MSFRILEFVLILGFVKRIGSFPLGCTHNKTSYEEGEIVRIADPCLNCICQKGALECSFRVCGEHTDVVPPGCFLLHKPNQCCPQLFCDKNFNSTEIESWTEYKVKSNLHGNDCNINGSTFAEGSAVASSQPCEYCYCFRGEIKCLKPRCLQFLEKCTPAFEKSSCCPTHFDCRDANINVLSSQMKHFVSNNSSRSLSSLSIESGKQHINMGTVMDSKGDRNRELIPTETGERNSEETTKEPELETTVENYITTIGFQTTKTEYFSDEPTRIEFAEESTLATETDGYFTSTSGNIKESDVQVRSKLHEFNTNRPNLTEISTELSDGSRENASQEDDYDLYDYSEPQLPPSLPNLVIFPFVAADAMVKDKIAGLTDVAKKDEIEKIDDSHYVFYNDDFLPPIKTEGGFIPKEPSKSENPIHESLCLNREQADSSSKGLKESVGAMSQANSFLLPHKEMNFSKLIGSYQTKKPVTVTYKNFIVDFYPNYLITTKKGIQSQHPPQQPAIEEVLNLQKKKIHVVSPPSDAVSEAPVHLPDAKNKFATAETNPEIPAKSTEGSPIRAPVSEIPIYYEFINPFSLEEITSRTTTTSTSTKHKFSSKIRSQLSSITSTAEPKLNKFNPKAEPEVVTKQLSFPELSAIFSITEKTKIYSENRKPVTKEEITGQTVKLPETKKEELGLFQPSKSGNLSNQNRKSEVDGVGNGENRVSHNGGTYLKLAGCNIYGMMYRVGKVITELSGPCLECQCTSVGVQCKPLKC